MPTTQPHVSKAQLSVMSEMAQILQAALRHIYLICRLMPSIIYNLFFVLFRFLNKPIASHPPNPSKQARASLTCGYLTEVCSYLKEDTSQGVISKGTPAIFPANLI